MAEKDAVEKNTLVVSGWVVGVVAQMENTVMAQVADSVELVIGVELVLKEGEQPLSGDVQKFAVGCEQLVGYEQLAGCERLLG